MILGDNNSVLVGQEPQQYVKITIIVTLLILSIVLFLVVLITQPIHYGMKRVVQELIIAVMNQACCGFHDNFPQW